MLRALPTGVDTDGMTLRDQDAAKDREFIMNANRMRRKLSNQGIQQNARFEDRLWEARKRFMDYWYNDENAGKWFDAPFLAPVIVEEPDAQKPASTIPSPGKKLAKGLYETEREVHDEINVSDYNDSTSMSDSMDDSD